MQTAAGVAVGVAGVALAGAGIWARRDVERALAREHVDVPLDSAASGGPVRTPRDARALAELIRERTLEGAGGRTYAETDQYVAADGSTTSDAALALTDEHTGLPVTNPDYELWIRSTTLQTALMQAYLAFRLADLSLLLGCSLAAAGTGIAARR